MSAQHTPGLWIADDNEGFSPWTIWSRMTPTGHGTPGPKVAQIVGDSAEADANARLIATSPELLAAVEAQYIELADIHNEWKGRATIAGQERLCRLRDLICKATGREPQDVQDDYGNRNLIAPGAAA